MRATTDPDRDVAALFDAEEDEAGPAPGPRQSRTKWREFSRTTGVILSEGYDADD
jgi:hypothetical protein